MTKRNKKIEPSEIAFDFDGVIGDSISAMLEYIRAEVPSAYNVKYENIKSYLFENCFKEIDKAIIDESVRRINYNHSLVYPIDGAIEVLRKIAKVSDIIVITARPSHRPVFNWFRDNANDLMEKLNVFAVGDYYEKVEMLRRFGRKFFVEDRLETCHMLSKEDIKPIVFLHPWNISGKKKFIHVNGWKELEGILDL